MTDERLDQILKQALAPEIDDSEIQIRRKVRNRKMNMKKIALCGLTACAAVTVAVTGGYFRGGTKIEESNVAVTNDVLPNCRKGRVLHQEMSWGSAEFPQVMEVRNILTEDSASRDRILRR